MTRITLATAEAELTAARAARQRSDAQVQRLLDVVDGAAARVAWIKAADAAKIISAALQVHDRLVAAETAAEKRLKSAVARSARAPGSY